MLLKGGENMRIYACLLGDWVDITDDGTVEDNKNPVAYFKENLTYVGNSKVATAFEYDYININYQNKSYRIHPSMIKIIK
jgi:hypothetical protein